jgi:hypothetical protein
MGTAHAPTLTGRDRLPSVYSYVGSQIDALVPRFGLQSMHPQIRQVYELICGESLAFPLGRRPLRYSRINHDGTPFQFSVTLGSRLHWLQFLSEAGTPGLSGAERIRVSRACIAAVARSVKADGALSAVADLLDTMAPEAGADLLADPAGAFWIGAGFGSAGPPRIKVYINAKWGAERDRWARLEHFASHWDLLDPWQRLERELATDLKPLGTALTLGEGKPPSGRIYLSTYGRRAAYYEGLARSIGGDGFGQVFRRYARHMLGQDYPYPTQTAVCSFGLGAGPALDLKVEWCAHCLFASDLEATSRLRSWFAQENVDETDYLDVLDVLSVGPLSSKAPDLHCYIGLGLSRGATYSGVYLKPRLIANSVR